jgi:hypothetical protein
MPFTPVKLAEILVSARGVADLHQADIAERAPVCGMTRDAAADYARRAYGVDAAIENDETRELEPVACPSCGSALTESGACAVPCGA